MRRRSTLRRKSQLWQEVPVWAMKSPVGLAGALQEASDRHYEHSQCEAVAAHVFIGYFGSACWSVLFDFCNISSTLGVMDTTGHPLE